MGIAFLEAVRIRLSWVDRGSVLYALTIAPDVDATMRLRKRYDHKTLPHSLFFGGLGSVVLAFIAYTWLAANAPSTSGDLISPDMVALLAPGLLLATSHTWLSMR